MFSRRLLGTDNKVKMSWVEYIFTYLIPTWFQSFDYNFRMWSDLMTGNYASYTLIKNDDPFEECYNYFWSSINLDETYPKEFLESLMQMADDVETGKILIYPMEGVMKELKNWCEEIELNIDEELENE